MKLVESSFEILAMSFHDEFPYNYENPLTLIEAAGRTCYKSEGKIDAGTAIKFCNMIRQRKHLSVFEHSWETRSYNWENRIVQSLLESDIPFSISVVDLDGVDRILLISGNLRMFEEWNFPGSYIKLRSRQEIDDLTHGQANKHFSATVKFICDRGVSHEIVRHRKASYSQESTRFCNYTQGRFGEEITFIQPEWVIAGTGSFPLQGAFMDQDDVLWSELVKMSEEVYKCLISEHNWLPQEARSVLPNTLKTEIVVTATWKQWQHIFNLRVHGTTGAPHPQMVDLMKPVYQMFGSLEPKSFV